MMPRRSRTISLMRAGDSLGESFEVKEEELFGEGGFEKIVDEVTGIEKNLGTFELSQFTPKT